MEHCAIRTLTSSFPADHLRAQKNVHAERRQTSRGPGPRSASSLQACDGLNVWTHSRGTASAAVPPCRQKDYPVLSEAVDVSSEVDRCARWRGVGVSFSGTYGLPSACARVTILCTQVVGHPHGRSARAPVHDPGLVGHAPLLRCIMHHPLVHLGLGLCLSLLCDHYGCSLFCLFVLSACACSSDVTVTSYSHSPSVSLRAILTQPNVLSLTRGEFSWHLPHRNLRRCANG